MAATMAAAGFVHVPRLAAQASSTSAAEPTFDAASIKTPDPREGIDIKFLPGRFVATNATLALLIQQAYGLEARELVGGPDWIRGGDTFDIVGTTTSVVSKEQLMLMLRTLLSDRFKLELTTETRAGPTYTLTANKPRGFTPPAHPDERSLVSNGREDKKGVISFYIEGHNASVADLATRIAGLVRAPVIDQTHVAGNYDFRINYTYDSAFGGLEPDPDIPTIFTALENQVGLKLVAGKGPIEVHVVRSATKPRPD
jgi:uncharacterized protein (TIGR03435 family)